MFTETSELQRGLRKFEWPDQETFFREQAEYVADALEDVTANFTELFPSLPSDQVEMMAKVHY